MSANVLADSYTVRAESTHNKKGKTISMTFSHDSYKSAQEHYDMLKDRENVQYVCMHKDNTDSEECSDGRKHT